MQISIDWTTTNYKLWSNAWYFHNLLGMWPVSNTSALPLKLKCRPEIEPRHKLCAYYYLSNFVGNLSVRERIWYNQWMYCDGVPFRLKVLGNHNWCFCTRHNNENSWDYSKRNFFFRVVIIIVHVIYAAHISLRLTLTFSSFLFAIYKIAQRTHSAI